MRKTILALLTSLIVVGCTAAQQQDAAAPQPVASDRFQLRVSLFAWIPENEQFARWIESGFEAENRDIDLVIRPMNQASTADLSYDVEAATRALREEGHADFQHLVEIDTVILGSLLSEDGESAIQPFTVARTDFLPFARQAVQIGGTTYGVPHWSCGYFIMSTNSQVAAAGSAAELQAALTALGTARRDLGGAIGGGYDSVLAYLDAYLDTYPNSDPAAALDDVELDDRVRSALTHIGAACTSDGNPNCAADDNVMEREFANGRLDALIGYSERLNTVFRTAGTSLRPADIRLSPAPLGTGRETILYTDALVQSVRCTTERCRDAARRFAEFYVSDRIFAVAMMGRDAGQGAVPRYLLPSTRAAINRPEVRRDPIYRQLITWLPRARPYPNQGVPEARAAGHIKSAMTAVLHTPR